MKLLSLILLPILFFSEFAFARLTDGKVHFKLNKTEVVAIIDDGFHFNKEAPASATVGGKEIEPSVKGEKELKFEIGKSRNVALSFYVCDDKKTVCEEHNYTYTVLAGKLILHVKPAVAVSGGGGKGTSDKGIPGVAVKTGLLAAAVKTNSHGFIENELALAMQVAFQKNQLVLVDYGAPWCPACVRYETEVFGTPEFQKLTKNVVKLYLNADKAANKEFGTKYKIKALPTLILLDANGGEVYRSLDFKTTAVLAKELTPYLKKQALDLAALEEKALKGDREIQKQLADRAYSMLDYPNAVKWYAMLIQPNSNYATSEIAIASEKYESDKKANRDAYIQVLKKWITALPESYVAMVARTDLAEASKTEGDAKLPPSVTADLQTNVLFAQSVLASPVKMKKMWKDAETSFAPYEKEEVLSYLMATYELLGQKEDVEAVKADMRGLLEKKKLSVDRPGEVLAGLAYFRKADLTEKEGQWLLDLDKANPGTYSYPMKLARFHVRQKDYAKALPYAELAVERGEELRLINLKTLAEVQKELKQNKAAKKSIEQALALPEAKTERNQTTVKALQDLKKSL